jgi:hypothetical protein
MSDVDRESKIYHSALFACRNMDEEALASLTAPSGEAYDVEIQDTVTWVLNNTPEYIRWTDGIYGPMRISPGMIGLIDRFGFCLPVFAEEFLRRCPGVKYED